MGASLATGLARRHPDWDIVALDSLRRRGSELNLPRLAADGVEFVHGDVREPADLAGRAGLDALIECSAEPSALSGLDGETSYVVHSNLLGAYNCLELATREQAQFLFLSTSRVYPVRALNSVALDEKETRFELAPDQVLPGVSSAGISESFPLEGARTLYGATKLAAELLIAEYAESMGLTTVVNRCGVIAGPWQMGKVDQGFVSLWALHHHFERPLTYIGYGGRGRQVRDLLHVEDLVDLIDEQVRDPDGWRGVTANVGGGRRSSISLNEATALCRELSGNEVEVTAVEERRRGDVPLYLSDCGRLQGHTDWQPKRGPRAIFEDVFAWIRDHEDAVSSALGFGSDPNMGTPPRARATWPQR